MFELDQDQAAAVRELRELQAQAEKIATLVEERKEELRKLGAGRYLVGGEPALDIVGGVAFDAQTAVEALTDEQYQSILLPKPDSKMAKRVLTGEQYERCQKSRALTVRPL